MDEVSQQTLNNILKKNPDTLTKDEIDFLKARITYLKESQVKEYESVLKPKEEVKEEPEVYLSTKDLKAKAVKLGLNVKSKKREEIEKLIKENS